MSELGDAAQEAYRERSPTGWWRAVEPQMYAVSDTLGAAVLFQYLCACVAIAEAIRWAWANRRGGYVFPNTAGTSTSMRRTCVLCGEPHFTP